MTARRLALALPLCLAWAVAAQESLDRVRQLYASAEYEAALSSLDRLKASRGDSSPEIDRYTVLCLMGLGRTAEADQVIERIVTIDPLYQPDANDVSPAVRAAFSAVRHRVLPNLARKSFTEGKTAYLGSAFEEAAQKFRLAGEILDSPELAGQPDLLDLRVLTAGFWALTRDALPAEVEKPDRPPAPDAGPPPPEPIPIREDMPRWTFATAAAHYDARLRAAVEVEIDEAGNVIGVIVLQSSHPGYNQLLIETARGWKYAPTLRDGKPVKTRKRVDIVVRPM